MTANPAAVIVVGVDGSDQSLSAVEWAAREAAVRQCRLRIVHAFLWPLMGVSLEPPPMGPPDAGLQRAAEKLLSIAVERARQVAPSLDVSTDLPVCAPAAALIDASRDAALVVVGHRGLGGFTGLLVGSVGVQAAAHAACPVVVVRDSPSGDAAQAGPATGQVVVGVDGSDLSDLAVDFAFAHAERHGLGVVAVHSYQWRIGSYYADHLSPWPARLLAEAVADYCEHYPDVPLQQKVVQGESADVLIAESAGAALTVVGSRGRGGFTGLLLGSTSQRVLHHASGTVAIVRAQATHGGGTIRVRQGVSDVPEPAQAATRPTAPAAAQPTLAAQPAGERTGADAAGAGAPPVSSFAKALFTDRLPAAMVMPYPRLARDEQRRVDALIADAHEFLDACYDPVKVEQEQWVGDDVVLGLGERGLLGLYVAPEYGGPGVSMSCAF
ncbi:universal stress protein [Nonomuraea sp. NPDC048892]|uniref:universal stress protein n=1 Tax=Nonomuraea sp. NPDC048892 TaxID=3154624 RepID=UPI00340F1A9F